MASKVEIINQALGSIGALRIAAADEDSENARHMNSIYDVTVKGLLRGHPWSFAKKETALSQVVEDPVLDDYEYIYTLPSDFVKLTKTSQQPTYSHKIKGKRLYSNASSINIEYIYFVEDPTVFDDSFVEALAGELAAKIAYSLTRDKEVAKIAIALAKSTLMTAKNMNAQEVTPDAPTNDTWINSRV